MMFMPGQYPDDIFFENVSIVGKNFSGIEKEFNPAGRRNFLIVIEDEELALQLMEDGWNVKPPRSGDGSNYLMPVEVDYSVERFAPAVYSVTDRRRKLLGEDTISVLDKCYIPPHGVDVTVKGRVYAPGKVKARVRVMYARIEEDRHTRYLEDKYAYLPGDEEE